MPEIQALQAICVRVDQSYPEIEEEFSLPIAETTEDILSGLGLQTVAEGAVFEGLQVLTDEAVCDGSLTITLVGTPLGKDYVNVGLAGKGSSHCYTGAAISGQMVIAVADRVLLTLPFDAKVAPRSGTITTCPGKTKAPFGSLWQTALIEDLTAVWGPPPAVQALGDQNARMRNAASQRLREIGPPAEAALTQGLQDNDWAVRVGAASFLQQRQIHSAQVVATLIAALEHEEEQVRADAAFALGGSPPTDEVIHSLITALRDEAAVVREQAAQGLRRMEPQVGAVPALIEALSDEDADVREAAAYTLGKEGPQEGVVTALIQALADEDEWVRGAAAVALGDIGPQESVIPALIQALSDTSRNVRSTVARELKEMTGKDFGQDAARWLAWWETQQ